MTATTAIGLLVSTFTPSQVAAVFVTAILTILPTTQFSGLLQPVSTLEGNARLVGSLWPTTYYMHASVGAFTKALGPRLLVADVLALAAFIPVLTAMTVAAPEAPGVVIMKRLANIFWLGTKELRSLQRDTVLVVFVVYAFTLAIYSQAKGTSSEVHNASIAFVDEDQSALSKRLFESFYPPRFKYPRTIEAPRDRQPDG